MKQISAFLKVIITKDVYPPILILIVAYLAMKI